MGRREATNKPRYKVDSCPFSFKARSSMASPYLSERVCAAILRSLCADEGKMHGEAVVSCLRKQRLVINIADEEAVFSFADAVDETNYDARGMIDDFFPRYPYKTTRNSWRFFKVWLNDGTGQLYKEFCEEWIDLAQKFLRECSSCRACARKPTTEKLMQVFGTVRPYYIGERPRRMYQNDDQMMLSSELYPVAGGLVAEGNLPEVKGEVWDAPPGFAYPLIRREVGGPSGEKRVPVARARQKIQSDRDDEPAMEGRVVAGDQSRIDPMLVDPAVMLLHELSGATHL